MSITDIIQKLTQNCERNDCELWADEYQITNSVGSTSVFNCSICKNRWSVFYPKNHNPITWNKQGEPTCPPTLEPEINNIT